MSRLCATPSAARSRAASSGSTAVLRRHSTSTVGRALGNGRVPGEIGLHQMVRLTEQRPSSRRWSSAAAERTRRSAAGRWRGTARRPRRAPSPPPSGSTGDRRSRRTGSRRRRPAAHPTSRRAPTPRCARRRRRARPRPSVQTDDWDGRRVQRISVVRREQPLLVAEDRAPKREVVAAFGVACAPTDRRTRSPPSARHAATS